MNLAGALNTCRSRADCKAVSCRGASCLAYWGLLPKACRGIPRGGNCDENPSIIRGNGSHDFEAYRTYIKKPTPQVPPPVPVSPHAPKDSDHSVSASPDSGSEESLPKDVAKSPSQVADETKKEVPKANPKTLDQQIDQKNAKRTAQREERREEGAIKAALGPNLDGNRKAMPKANFLSEAKAMKLRWSHAIMLAERKLAELKQKITEKQIRGKKLDEELKSRRQSSAERATKDSAMQPHRV